VSSEKRSAIFEPFFTTKSEGSGLGLWIVQQIATAHRGLVTVEDRPGGGAAFTLQLPYAPGRAADPESYG
jgi:signal transduction histidine kinase